MVKEQLEQGKVQAVWSNQTAFLALLQNSQVLAWGESSGSGDITRSFKPDRYAQVVEHKKQEPQASKASFDRCSREDQGERKRLSQIEGEFGCANRAKKETQTPFG